jgi:2-dehydropantoate 2-reductase
MPADKKLPSAPRIAVIGGGAISGYYGGRLAEHGHDVRFLLRSDFHHVREHGLQIFSPMGHAHLTVSCASNAADIGPCDLVIIGVKATANDVLPGLLPPLMHENTALLLLQNGLGGDEFLARHFGADQVLGGLCFVCINRTAPGVIHHLAQGHIGLGEFGGAPMTRTRQIAEWFKSAKVGCSVEESLAAARWKKLVWNIPFNGLSVAAGGLDTARILGDAGLEQLVRDLMSEVVEGASRLGYPLPANLIESMIANTRPMQAYKTSSLLDYEAGREMEIEPIWGEPCRRAQAAGASVPRLEMLYHLLRNIAAEQSAKRETT